MDESADARTVCIQMIRTLPPSLGGTACQNFERLMSETLFPRTSWPHRQLLSCIPIFDNLDFYHIDEIPKLGTADDLSSKTGISLGNAGFILEKIRAEMKRVDRERRNLAA
ncbi:hypothetical protein R3P38DRAFT_3454720 [Favolaschia claudopus]|uniref:Uncharacterized protein n=1 Tax=Favolaschia claudopus TaxID=2862362 RepID=A0AAV9ZIT9_9AGAR